MASTDAAGFNLVAKNLQQVFGEVIIIPGITVGGTDSKHYGEVSDNAYRFNPMLVTSNDISGFHGTNERISTANLGNAVKFFVSLIQDL